jgi:hypothetical protein
VLADVTVTVTFPAADTAIVDIVVPVVLLLLPRE